MHRLTSFSSALVVASMFALAACSPKPHDSAYLNRGGPESLLDVSSEVVNLSTGTPTELQDLSNWIDKDQPTRAELHCTDGEKRCTEARKVLELHGVPVVMGATTDNTVTLVYERILARDCNQRYVDDGMNDYNAPHAAFGCAVAANIVQQVTDKQAFISPNLSDDPNASRAVGNYRGASVPRAVPATYNIGDSAVAKSKTQ